MSQTESIQERPAAPAQAAAQTDTAAERSTCRACNAPLQRSGAVVPYWNGPSP